VEVQLAKIKSQIKRMRKSKKEQLRNKSVKSALKTYISKFKEALEAGDKARAEAALKIAIKALDSAATKGIIHKNNAANKKSRLMKKYNQLQIIAD